MGPRLRFQVYATTEDCRMLLSVSLGGDAGYLHRVAGLPSTPWSDAGLKTLGDVSGKDNLDRESKLCEECQRKLQELITLHADLADI